jgi:hypothetical protein
VTGEVRTDHAALVDQLVGEVRVRLLDPLAHVLGGTFHLKGATLTTGTRAQRWAQILAEGDEDDLRALVTFLMPVLYPGSGENFNPPRRWWRTPVGLVVARRLGHPTAQAVPDVLAGAMLGITRHAVHDLIARGKLARHPDGGVSVASVRQRLCLQLTR